MMKKLLLLPCLIIVFGAIKAQMVPSKAENIESVVTFGKNAPKGWGDDDYSQVFFFTVPTSFKSPIYIRVYDPECFGDNDQKNREYNTTTHFRIIGGEGAFSNKDSKNINPVGNYDAGTLLHSKTFKDEAEYDSKWYTFGPINPSEGEMVEELKARVFKVIIEGTSGDDGNLYKIALSQSPYDNISILGGNAFTYEYSFRLKSEVGSVAYFYPFIDKNTVKIKQHNFDFDNDGAIKVYSAYKNGHYSAISNDGNWSVGLHDVQKEEQGRSMNVRLIKKASFNNDMTLYITNEYNIPVPMFATPIGGAPKYIYKIDVKYKVR